MIDRAQPSTDLIGYLTFDIPTHQATLVMCGRSGRPVREIALEPVGMVLGVFVRLAILFGHFARVRRAIACDDCDRRHFSVWIAPDRSVVVSDDSGERWLRSIDSATIRARRQTVVLPNPDVIRVVRRHGIGDASLN